MLTSDQLAQEVEYNPHTGLFTRLQSHTNRIKVGDLAGSLDAKGYLTLSVLGKKYKAHRLAYLYMMGHWPTEMDHINRVKSDNRWCNLRQVTSAENQQNRNSSNVYHDKELNSFRVKFTRHGKAVELGRFKDKELAELIASMAKEKFKQSGALWNIAG